MKISKQIFASFALGAGILLALPGIAQADNDRPISVVHFDSGRSDHGRYEHRRYEHRRYHRRDYHNGHKVNHRHWRDHHHNENHH